MSNASNSNQVVVSTVGSSSGSTIYYPDNTSLGSLTSTSNIITISNVSQVDYDYQYAKGLLDAIEKHPDLVERLSQILTRSIHDA